jgi:uncharacterized protein YdhG (YjbR/CyaY superfamily)
VPKPESVDAYLASLPPDRRQVLEQMRAEIKAAAPEATELISYNMPAYKWHGKFVVSFEAFKSHNSLFPSSDGVKQALGADIEPYLSGKGTISFPADQPIPAGIVGRIVKARLAELASETS